MPVSTGSCGTGALQAADAQEPLRLTSTLEAGSAGSVAHQAVPSRTLMAAELSDVQQQLQGGFCINAASFQDSRLLS